MGAILDELRHAFAVEPETPVSGGELPPSLERIARAVVSRGMETPAIVFLEAYGVDTKAALEVLGGGLAGSTVLGRKGAGMLAREFEPGFRLALHHKDLGIVTSAAREAGVVIPLGAVVGQLVAAMVARGDGGLDRSGLLKLVQELSGRQG